MSDESAWYERLTLMEWCVVAATAMLVGAMLIAFLTLGDLP